jgi:glycosyltransferase involved in cell wall biosynthesis
MRIGFDGSCLSNRRGFGRFARQLLRALGEADSSHEIVVFVDRPSSSEVMIPQSFRRMVVEVKEAPSRAASSTGRRTIPDVFAMGRAVARTGLDIMYFPASYTFFPVWSVDHVVVTMHDTLGLAQPNLVFPTWKGRFAWTLKEHAAARWADKIVTVSESARRDIIEWFRFPGDHVRVVSEGPDPIFEPRPRDADFEKALRRWGIDPSGRYLLYVGGLSPHKNLLRLIEAFGGLGSDGEGTRLVLVGDTSDVFHTHVPELRALVQRLELHDRVLFTGFVPDEDLVFLYNGALGLVQPSLMEGFGLPPVEAMVCGVPVLASAAGSLLEVVGDAGLSFDPTDVASMVEAMRSLLIDRELRARLSVLSLRRAVQFTWTSSAQALLDIFEELRPAAPSRSKSA